MSSTTAATSLAPETTAIFSNLDGLEFADTDELTVFPNPGVGIVGSLINTTDAVIRVSGESDAVTETHEHEGDSKSGERGLAILQPFSGHFPLWRQK
jgi:hypothetical protein